MKQGTNRLPKNLASVSGSWFAHGETDGTLIQAWASHTSFQSKADTSGASSPDEPPPDPPSDGNGASRRNAGRDWRGQKRSNETHQSRTDPDARLARNSDGQSSIWS